MKKIYRLLCLALAFVMLMPLLVSCRDEDTLPDEEPEEQGIVIVSKGVPRYTIVYAKSLNNECVNLAYKLQDEIRERVGVTVQIKVEDDQKDADAKEILIGDTAYEESKTVSKMIGKKQYAIMAEGNKIVVAAKSSFILEEALYYFIEQLIPRNVKTVSGKFSLYHEDMIADYEELSEPLFNGESLSKYSIVYSKNVPGMEDHAADLAKRIKSALKLDIDYYPDTFREETEYEILVGLTNRDYSVALFADGNVPLMSHKLVVDGTKIQLVAAGGYSMGELVSKFVLGYVLGTNLRNLRDGVYMDTDLLPIRSQALTEGSTLRVMTSNVLADIWEANRGYPSIAARAEMYAATLGIYRPDLVGIQETDQAWLNTQPYYLKYLKDHFSLDYEWIENTFKTTSGSKVPNMSSLIYRKDVFSLVSSGAQEFSFANDKKYKIRVATWAVFTHKQSNEKYALVNTH